MERIRVAGITCALILSTCFGARANEKKEAEAAPVTVLSDEGWIKGFARQNEKGSLVPRALLAKIEKDFSSTEKKEPAKRKLVVVRTEFTEDSPRTLRGNTRITTAQGGGLIDLADVTLPLKGSYQLSLHLDGEAHVEQVPSKVYFVSAGVQRNIDGEKFGSGCGVAYDVTTFFKKEMSRGGFKLFTADQRDVGVLRGTFVFVASTPEALQLASLTIFDSRHPGWDCASQPKS